MPEAEAKINLPKHLVIIPDGNVRWAQKRRVSPEEGYAAGIGALKSLLTEVDHLVGIDVVTVWGFSTENWVRPEEERVGVMATVQALIQTEGEDLAQRGYKFRHIGRRDRLPQGLIEDIEKLEQRTAGNSGKTIIMGFDYGGRDEIVRAVNRVGGAVVDQESFKQFLDTAGIPDPDLIIRTSGEVRTSGIYPYQGTYAEFVSSPVLMPDFDRREFYRCLDEYSKRQRNFGTRAEVKHQSPFAWLNLEEESFTGYLQAVGLELDRVTQEVLSNWRAGRFYRRSEVLQEDIQMYQELLTGGKKLRPAIGILAYESYSGESEYRKGMLQAFIGYEMIHNSFLIHDDIEDNSSERRGKPSVHEQYRLKHEESGGLIDHKNYGVGVALNTGSLGAFKALDVLWQIDNRPNRIVEAQRWLRYVIETTLQGQRRDLADIKLDQLTENYVYSVYHQKTAIYTVVGPLVLGAILAGASRKDLAYLNTFGVNLGIAFQMVDDHLGMFGNEEILGKPVDSDVKEGKKTLHFVEAYKRSDASEREVLKKAWGNNDLTQDELKEVQRMIERLGVQDFVLNKAVQLVSQARSVIPEITFDETTRKIFEDMTEFIVKRDF